MKAPSIFRWMLISEWRAHIMQIAVALIAIAIGVAMAFSIHLINSAAFNEFSAASKSLSGLSDLQVRGRKAFFDEALYPLLAIHRTSMAGYRRLPAVRGLVFFGHRDDARRLSDAG